MTLAELLKRLHHADLEIRGGDGRTICGLAVPFDQEAVVVENGRRYTEVFKRGAFARTINERGPASVKLLVNHDRGNAPAGVAQVLREDAAGLYAELKVSKTRSGDELLELVGDGALDSLSIGFRSIEAGDRWNRQRNRVERTEVALKEISAVWQPAYPDAQIVGVRNNIQTLTAEAANRRLALALHGVNQ